MTRRDSPRLTQAAKASEKGKGRAQKERMKVSAQWPSLTTPESQRLTTTDGSQARRSHDEEDDDDEVRSRSHLNNIALHRFTNHHESTTRRPTGIA